MGSNDLKAFSEELDVPAFELGPRYEVNSGGVFFIDVKRDRDSGELSERPPMWLCDQVELLGCGADESGRQHILMRWRRQGSGEVICAAIPNAEIGEREGWARLRNGGLTVATERTAQSKLAYWLQKGGPNAWHDIVTMSGWQHGAYVLPNGEIIGKPDRPMHFNGDLRKSSAYRAKGELGDWQASVGALSRGNPLAIAAIACALAGPLLELIGARDGIGLHLYTRTSSGKSTCGDAAASVWGHPEQLLHSWDGTTIGLTNEAETSNDRLLYLDEIGAGDARKIGPAIYTMLNGVSRLQGAKEGGNRAKRSWRLTMISTGEVGMSQYLTEGGQVPRGGQEIRLLDIPADVGAYRAFDCLHGMADGDAFATTFTEVSRLYYGTLGRAFVAWLIAHRTEAVAWIGNAQQRMLDAVPEGAAPTVRRATRKFGVLLAAVEMATHAGLTGWTADEAREGVVTTWRRWLAVFGTEDRDDARLIDQAESVLIANQFSRFVVLPMGEHEPVVHNLMGYKRNDDGGILFLVTPGAFKAEVIAGHEARRACEVLHKAGMLDRPNGRPGWTVNGGKSIGQVYRMRTRKSEAGNDPEVA